MFTANFQEYLNKHADKSIQEALSSVLSSRGKGKGFAINTAPNASKQPLRNANWNAVMLTLAPMRAQMCNCMFMQKDVKESFDSLEKWCTIHHHAVKCWMQKPFQFNLYSHRFDVESMKIELLKIKSTL